MRKIALDIGKARIGVAVSQGQLALPHSVIPNDSLAMANIEEVLDEFNPEVVYVGLPLSLSGSRTMSTEFAIAFAAKILDLGRCEVRLIDERLTSKSASAQLRSAGKNSRTQKSIIDASAAAIILEFALASEKAGFAGKKLEELDA